MNVPRWAQSLLLIWMLAGRVAFAQPAPGDETTRLIQFDIPVQALSAALEKYSALAKRALLYDSSLTAGRQSREVSGLLTPDAALNILLNGSGLQVRYCGRDAFVIVQGEDKGDTGPQSEMTEVTSERHYYGMVQMKIRAAFCRNPNTMPGKYRTLLRFWIGSAGAVEQAQLISSTGDVWLDNRLLDALRDLQVGAAPPAGMEQPFTMLILPKLAARTRDCVHD